MSPRPRSRSAGTAAAVAAAVTGFIAFILVLAGGGLLWANGHFKDDQGYVSTSSERFSSPARAITAEDLDVNSPGWVSGGWGTVRLRVASAKPLFVGVAPTRDVDAYLRGVERSELTDIEVDPFRARYDEHPGERRPAAPATQAFWTASGTSELRWHVRSGRWTVVVMNADGSPGVAAAINAGTKLSFLAPLAWTLLGGGLVFVLATGALMIFATRPPAPRQVAMA